MPCVMENQNSTDQCYDCRCTFRKNEMRKITMNNSPTVLFICNSCSGDKPKPSDIETALGNLKLFI